MHHALFEQHYDVVRQLVKRGADIHAVGRDGVTLLDAARGVEAPQGVLSLLDGTVAPGGAPAAGNPRVPPGQRRVRFDDPMFAAGSAGARAPAAGAGAGAGADRPGKDSRNCGCTVM
jgi:hypothetical protein